jgi:hypothetical protein
MMTKSCASVGIDSVKGSPHWVVELDTRRRKTLPMAGRPMVLGAAEGVLAVEMGRAAAKNQPYAEEEVTQLLLDTAKAASRIAWLDAGVR